MMVAFIGLLALYAMAQGVRFGLALAFLLRPQVAPADETQITVMQPILSGDPLLADCLRANQENAAQARFLLLVDADDAEGQRVAHALQSLRTRMIIGPPPRHGENPKVAKLARALPLVETPYLAVLDDDTVLAPGDLARAAGALAQGDLVTGLPFYAPTGGLWSGLVAAFVNGAAMITYPAAALARANRTINGMFYVVRGDALRELGGFAAIATALTDDYAVARLFSDAGRTIVQTRCVHPIHTTVRGPGHYLDLMRRWMIFANRYVGENLSLFTLGVIGAPTLLAPILLVLAAMLGPFALAAVVAMLVIKALAMGRLRAKFGAPKSRWVDIALEPFADLLTPLHLIAALVAPHRFAWRQRKIHMRGGSIHYD
jgi:ceramide glucosyltransferase